MTLTGSPSSRDQPLESLRQFPRVPSVIHQRRGPQPPPQFERPPSLAKPSGAPYQPVPAEFATGDYLSDRRQWQLRQPATGRVPTARGRGSASANCAAASASRTAKQRRRGMLKVRNLGTAAIDLAPPRKSQRSSLPHCSPFTTHCQSWVLRAIFQMRRLLRT